MNCLFCQVVVPRKTKVLSDSGGDATRADGCTVCDLPLLLQKAMLYILHMTSE